MKIFIPSYHRPRNLKTVKYLKSINYMMSDVYVFIDSEADDKDEYEDVSKYYGFNLVVFDMDEARKRYDYVHRPSTSRRSAGQARNMFHDYAKKNDIKQYLVMDDDTQYFYNRIMGITGKRSSEEKVKYAFEEIGRFIDKYNIGLFGMLQSGDFYGGINQDLIKKKVMNTTFYNTRFIYRGEKGVQDDDTSQYVGVLNEGYFTGSLLNGICLQQTLSATASGGLTDLYNECKLYNKAMVVPIQYPSCVRAERQVMNGGRIHHRIDYRYLAPKIMKGERDNIAWDTYEEDVPFCNEPKR